MDNIELLEKFEKRIMEIFDEEVKVDEKWSYGLKYSIKVLKDISDYEQENN